MTTTIHLELKNVSIGYDPDRDIIKNLSFTLLKGEKIALMGANGAGKSTLLKSLAGLMPHHSGNIHMENPKNVGYTFQEPDDQLFMNTVFDDVAFGPRNQGLAKDLVLARATAALETVGQRHNSHRPPYKLSGGEKRAVAIATVLSMSPELLLMDEPESGLDGFARKNLSMLLKSLDQTILFTTHDLSFAQKVADRIILLSEGEIVLEGNTEQVLSDIETLEKYHII